MNRKYRFEVEKEINDIVNWIKEYFSDGKPNGPVVIGISGGKDSTVTAALLVKALGADKVYGVLMPNGQQHDLDVAKRVVEHLGIESTIINIENICDNCYTALRTGVIVDKNHINQILTNTPARIRMTILYAIAANINGLVVNTCNASENYVGYSTKFGDMAGDFGLLENYYATEVIEIGKALGIPDEFVLKTPEDGMSGVSDEDNFGFTYKELDDYLIYDIVPSVGVLTKIKKMNRAGRHKIQDMPSVSRTYVDEWSF